MYLKRAAANRESARVICALMNIKRIPRSRSKYRCHTREVAYYVTMPLNCFDLAVVVSASHTFDLVSVFREPRAFSSETEINQRSLDI